MKRQSRITENERSDDFYESFASTRPGPLDVWTEPRTPDELEPVPATDKTTAVFTLVLALVIFLTLAFWFMQGIATIRGALPQSAQTNY